MFVSSDDSFWAFFLAPEIVKGKKNIVFMSECLKNRSEEEQVFTIAHEIAHTRLKHKSPILSNLTREETKRQEDEANRLANKWISMCQKEEKSTL
jgi:Zn-dependent peptidase ImmA (M78 family)